MDGRQVAGALIEADPEYARRLIASRHPEVQAVLRGLERTPFMIVRKGPSKGRYIVEFEVPIRFFEDLPPAIRGISRAPVLKYLLDTIPELAALDFAFGLLDVQKRLFSLNLAIHTDIHNWALTLWDRSGEEMIEREIRWIMGQTWEQAKKTAKRAAQGAEWTLTREDLLQFM